MQDLGKFLSKISPYPDPLLSLTAPLTAPLTALYCPLLILTAPNRFSLELILFASFITTLVSD